jgi:predicted transcriptional regulator
MRKLQRVTAEQPQQGELLALPRNTTELEEAIKRSKSIVTRRAALASAASLVPIPGLDIAVDIAAVMKLIPEINREFGLTPQQISKLSPGRQMIVYKSIVAIGSMMIGKLVTKEIAIEVLKTVGVRMTAKQVGKYVPVAGQALSVALGFAAMKYVGHQHIKDCQRVIEATLAAKA